MDRSNALANVKAAVTAGGFMHSIWLQDERLLGACFAKAIDFDEDARYAAGTLGEWAGSSQATVFDLRADDATTTGDESLQKRCLDYSESAASGKRLWL